MVVISNGFKNFHLVMAATEANARHILTTYIAGAYPTDAVIRVMSLPILNKVFNVPRFLARGEAIDDELVKSKWLPEIFHLFSLKLSNISYLQSLSEYLKTLSFKWYAHQASKDVKEAYARGARVYHYRAGFGGRSALIARELGMVTLCDHSIVHPLALDYMIENNGRFPPSDNRVNLSCFWQSILDDFDYADAILVNSEFVKSTFVSQGWESDLIHVAYLGVDAPFIKNVEAKKNLASDKLNGDLKLMFAGLFGQRKGADILIEALLELNDVPWCLNIAGSISPYLFKKHKDFFNDKRVNVLGNLERSDLAEKMLEADVFVFPSLAEGSARVIFEALACGCYVITTPNSGSIVENAIHGTLVSPGNVTELKNALVASANNIRAIQTIGVNNAKLIKHEYLQNVYGDRLFSLYDALVNQHGI